ncbi:site-specific integrase [Curtobacterium citreum]
MSSEMVSFEPRDEGEAAVDAVTGPGDDGFELAATGSLPAGLDAGQLARIRMLQSQAISDGTRVKYKREWGRFVEFCQEVGAEFLPAHPLTVAAYFEAAAADGKDDAGTPYASNTFNGWLAAIDKMHQLAGLPKPSDSAEVEATMAGLRRTNGGELRRMPALLLEELRHLVQAIDIKNYPRAVHGVRDYAIIVMGFAGAFRRSEIAALTIGDVSLHEDDGLRLRIRKSKTDQEARGRTKALPYGGTPATCPVCAFIRWIQLTEAISSARPRMAAMKLLATFDTDVHICAKGLDDPHDPTYWSDPLPSWRRLPKRMPLFRPISTGGKIFRDTPISGQVVQDAVVRHSVAAGLDAKHYGGHSLRAGFVTSALKKGLSPHQIMRQSWHTTERMIEVYSREDTPLDNNAVTEIGL